MRTLRPPLPERPRLRWLLPALVAAGIALRLVQYLHNRSLWLDEAMLAASILDRSPLELLAPLEYMQVAPAGFLAAQKAAVTLLGGSEHALRLLPLLAGIGALVAFRRLAEETLPLPAAALALLYLSLSRWTVDYSVEAKPYSLDLLAATLLLLLAVRMRRGVGPAHARRFAAAGALLVWLSFPAVLVLAGVTASLLAASRHDPAARRRLHAATALWGTSFVLSYGTSRAGMTPEGARYVEAFWGSGFPPLGEPGLLLPWVLRHGTALFASPAGLLFPALGALAFLAGGLALWRGDRRGLGLYLAPPGLALLAAALGLYPFGGFAPSSGAFNGRVLFYLLPPVLLVTACGAAWAWRAASRLSPVLGGALALAFALLPLPLAAAGFPYLRQELRPVLEYVQARRGPGDGVYVLFYAEPTFRYYAGRGVVGPEGAVLGWCAQGAPDGYARDLERLRGRRRVWVVLTLRPMREEVEALRAHLARAGPPLDSVRAHGAAAYLHDFGELRDGVPAPTVAVPAHPALDCTRSPWRRSTWSETGA